MLRHLLLAIAAVCIVSTSATAQIGIFSRSDCATLLAPSTGQTFCFDQTSNQLKSWSGGAPRAPGETLRGDNISPASYVTRVVGDLNGFNFTAPVLRLDDTTASTGRLADAIKRGTTVFSLYGTGATAFGTANVLRGSFATFQSAVANEGLAMHN